MGNKQILIVDLLLIAWGLSFQNKWSLMQIFIQLYGIRYHKLVLIHPKQGRSTVQKKMWHMVTLLLHVRHIAEKRLTYKHINTSTVKSTSSLLLTK